MVPGSGFGSFPFREQNLKSFHSMKDFHSVKSSEDFFGMFLKDFSEPENCSESMEFQGLQNSSYSTCYIMFQQVL